MLRKGRWEEEGRRRKGGREGGRKRGREEAREEGKRKERGKRVSSNSTLVVASNLVEN